MRPGRSAAGASRHGGPLTRRKPARFKLVCLLHNNPSVHLCPAVCVFPSTFMSALLQHACGTALRNDNPHNSCANKRKPRRGRDGHWPKCQPCPYVNVHAKGSQWRCRLKHEEYDHSLGMRNQLSHCTQTAPRFSLQGRHDAAAHMHT